jgi:hypothetical protein
MQCSEQVFSESIQCQHSYKRKNSSWSLETHCQMLHPSGEVATCICQWWQQEAPHQRPSRRDTFTQWLHTTFCCANEHALSKTHNHVPQAHWGDCPCAVDTCVCYDVNWLQNMRNVGCSLQLVAPIAYRVAHTCHCQEGGMIQTWHVPRTTAPDRSAQTCQLPYWRKSSPFYS